MADPVNVVCVANAWTKVATAVTAGSLINKKTIISYGITTRDTAGLAPTLATEGRRAFIGSSDDVFSYSSSRDVYIYAHGSVNGLVEVTV